MNRSAQNKLLIVLSILLVLCISGLGYWYFFMYRCGVLPQGYEFLDRFVVKNECKEREYKVKGIMYNIREDDSNIVFDFNAWDTDSRESLYYEDISVSKDILTGEFEVVTDTFGAVELDIRFEKGVFTLKEFNLASLNVEELKLTEEKYNEVFNAVYTAITRSPLVEDDYEYQIIPSTELNAVITEVRHRDLLPEVMDKSLEYNVLYYPEVYNSFTNRLLYRPWVLSYLYTKQEELGLNLNIQKEDIVEILLFDYDAYRASLKEGLVCNDPQPNDVKTIDESKYQESNSFACLMIYQISQNIELDDYNLINRYCNIEFFENSINNYIEEVNLVNRYTIIDYLGLLDSDVLTLNDEGRYSPLHSSNTASILADMYGVRELNGLGLTDDLDKRVDFVLDYIIDYGAPYLKNICSVSYFSNLAINNTELINNEELKSISDSTEKMLTTVNKKMLELMDDDMYASFLCIEGYKEVENSNIDKPLKIQILKAISLDFYNNDEIVGIWKNKEYDIRENARFLKLLMLNKEVLL